MLKKILATVLLLLTSVSLAACDGDKPSGPASDDTPPDVEPTTPVDLFEIYRDGTIISKIIIPIDASSDERNSATKLKNAIFQYTRQEIDILREDKVTEALTGAIVIGKTTMPESEAIYDTFPGNSAVIEIKNGNMWIGFVTKSGANSAINQLTAAMVGDHKSTVGVPTDFSVMLDARPLISDIPSFKGSKTVSAGEGSEMTYVDGTPEEFESFCQELCALGFTKVAEEGAMGNLFATFESDTFYLHTYYTAYSGQIRVITGPIAEMARVSYETDAPKTYAPYIASVPQPDNGLGLIMRLPDGRFIIVDGGYKDEDRVYKTLRQLVPTGKITIAAWFITHPHNDHYGGFTDFLINHGSDDNIVIERAMLNFTDTERYVAYDTVGDVRWDVNYIYKTVEDYAPNLPMIQVHTGQIIDFGDAMAEILYTIEDMMPAELPDINNSSLAIRMKLGDSSFMILGDTCYESGPIMHKMWGEYLQSDIVQVAHHGQWPSVVDIYNDIKAEVVLVPARFARYKYDINDSHWSKQTKAILSYAKDLYVTCDEIVKIDLPYKFKNNKEQMVDSIKNYVIKEDDPQ